MHASIWSELVIGWYQKAGKSLGVHGASVLTIITYMKNHQRKSKQTKFWKRARAVCYFHSFYNFALVLHGNALVFSQSEGWYSWTSLKWKHLVQNQFYVKHNTCRRKFLLCHDTSILRRKTKGKQSNILFSLFIYSTLINIKSSKFPMIQRR